jgi:alcohol dehydrogenase class IV
MIPSDRPTTFTFGLGPTIHYGDGAAGLAGPEMKALGARRVLLVTDPGVVAAGVTAPVLDSLARAGLEHEVFAGIATNPTDDQVMAAVEAYREHGADSILAVGGGSSLDVAKSAAAVAANGGHIREYEDGGHPTPEPPPPLAFVPTTAGTGAEVVGGTIITDSERRFKMHVVVMPGNLALCDPLLTLSLPRAMTAATGVDALSHAVGAYVSTERQPLADAYALYAIELVARWLRRAVEDGSDREARRGMMIASLTAGLSMKGGGSGEHAFAHGVNALHSVHHGVGCAIFLAPVMEHNLAGDDGSWDMAERYARIAVALGEEPRGPAEETARAGIAAVRRLVADVGIPTLHDVGVVENDVPALVEYVGKDEFHLSLNPVPIGPEDAERILRETLEERA